MKQKQVLWSRVDELFAYCPEAGRLVRKKSIGPSKANTIAGTVLFSAYGKPYRVVCVDGVRFPEHRLIWFLVFKKHPEYQIDHIDGDGCNNRLENLRDVTREINGRNQACGNRNTSGCVGVSATNDGMWKAAICVSGRTIRLGLFAEKQDAITARKAAEQRFGFHPNHGRSKTPAQHTQ